MRNEFIVEKTTNRGEFNRAYKIHLEQTGKIHCSRCGYNRGENDKRKWYGKTKNDKKIRFPEWKLVSKNKKQWMEKPIKIVTKKTAYSEYTEIKF